MWSPLSAFCASNLKSLQKPPNAPQSAFLVKIAETLNESKTAISSLLVAVKHPEEMLGNFTTKLVLLSKFEYTTTI
jgi:hypothetical protein